MGLAGSVEAFCFYEKRGRPPLLIIHSSSPDLRKIERLASFRQRDPRIAQAFIMFALLGVVFFPKTTRSDSHLPHAASDRLRDSSVPSCDAFATSCTPCIILCPSSLV